MIYVMRHGESTINVAHRLTCKNLEGDLTPLGREQATKAALWLEAKDVQFDRVFVSPFHRAQQTAQIVTDHLGLEITTLAELSEMDCGEFEGRDDKYSWGKWQQIFDRWLAAEWDATFPGGESYRDAHTRLSAVLEKALPHENTLMVTHGGITRAVIPYLCVNAAALQRVKVIKNTAFITLEHYDPGRYACRAWNLAEHLH